MSSERAKKKNLKIKKIARSLLIDGIVPYPKSCGKKKSISFRKMMPDRPSSARKGNFLISSELCRIGLKSTSAKDYHWTTISFEKKPDFLLQPLEARNAMPTWTTWAGSRNSSKKISCWGPNRGKTPKSANLTLAFFQNQSRDRKHQMESLPYPLTACFQALHCKGKRTGRMTVRTAFSSSRVTDMAIHRVQRPWLAPFPRTRLVPPSLVTCGAPRLHFFRLPPAVVQVLACPRNKLGCLFLPVPTHNDHAEALSRLLVRNRRPTWPHLAHRNRLRRSTSCSRWLLRH